MTVTVACRNPDPRFHADFPDIAASRGGDLFMVARLCGQWAYDATFSHGRPLTFFEPQARIILLRSRDEGTTFAPELTLASGLAFDPMISALGAGRLVAGVVMGAAGERKGRAGLPGVLHRHIPQLGTVITVRGVSLYFSDDDGATWSGEPRLAAPAGWENIYNLRKAIELPDSTILLPVTVGYPWRSRFVGCIRSWDEGRTWTDPSIVAEDPEGRSFYAAGRGYWEPAMAVQEGSTLVCICVLDETRESAPSTGQLMTGETVPRLMRVHSSDSGFTWCLPRDTGLRGDFPALLALPDARLLLTCTRRTPGSSEVAAYMSEDGGISWGSPKALRKSADHAFYYANTVMLPGGRLFTSVMTSGPDLIRFIETVRWAID